MTKNDLRTIIINDDELSNLFDMMYASINRDIAWSDDSKKKMRMLFDDCCDAYDEIRYSK